MKKNDKILIAVILLLGAITWMIIAFTKQEGSKVRVTVDGKEYKEFNLKQDTTYTVELENGEWNTFMIKDGHVDMTEASCPDKLCVNHSDISYNHETIVCLPNKVVLQIIDGEENDVDAVAK